jgi:hypothetical protein
MNEGKITPMESSARGMRVEPGRHYGDVVYVRPGENLTMTVEYCFGQVHLSLLSRKGFADEIAALARFRAEELFDRVELVSK